MKVTEIPIPKAYVARMNSDRCCRKVKSCGTNYFSGNQNRCGRLARFNVDGVKFCAQHAGEAALHYVINK